MEHGIREALVAFLAMREGCKVRVWRDRLGHCISVGIRYLNGPNAGAELAMSFPSPKMGMLNFQADYDVAVSNKYIVSVLMEG